MLPPLISHIKTLLEGTLPGVRAHCLMLPPGRELDIAPQNFPDVKQSAVLFLLFPGEKGLSTCLIKRPSSMKNHAGQYAFPGGQYDICDPSMEHTALREAREEVGILPGNIRLLGQLTPLYVSVSNFLITPIVGYCHTQPDFILNPAEADAAFTPAIQLFTSGSYLSEFVVDTNIGILNAPCYNIDGEIVWGATAMIIAEFAQIITKNQLVDQIGIMSV